LDGAKLKVRSLVEELETERARFEKIESSLRVEAAKYKVELEQTKSALSKATQVCAVFSTAHTLTVALITVTLAHAQDNSKLTQELHESQAEVHKQKARVDRTLKVAQTKLGEAKQVHDKQHAQLVSMANDLKVCGKSCCPTISWLADANTQVTTHSTLTHRPLLIVQASQSSFKELQATATAIQRQGKRAKEAAAAAEAALAKMTEKASNLTGALSAKTQQASELVRQACARAW